MKCPKTHVKEEFIMWWNMHFFRNAPKSKMFIYCFLIDRVLFSEMPHFYQLKTENEPKMNIYDFGAFRKKCICHHMINSSFTCFLGHFMLPPVYILGVSVIPYHPASFVETKSRQKFRVYVKVIFFENKSPFKFCLDSWSLYL